MPPVRRLLGTLLPIVALLVALATATSASAATPSASVAAKRCRGTNAVVGGKAACLKVGQRCKRSHRRDYLAAGYVCRRVGRRHHKHLKLRPASYAKRRHGLTIVLPKTGRPTYKQSLWLFDKAVAPLPGVKTPRGAVGRDPDGTMAIKGVLRYEKRLTRKQRRVVDKALRFHGGTVVTPGQASAARTSALGDAEAIAAEAVVRLQGHGIVFKHPVRLHALSDNQGSELAHTAAAWLLTGAKKTNYCEVSLRPKALNGSVVIQRETITHELMHCASAEFSPTKEGYLAQPKFLDEGLPEWAAYVVSEEWSSTLAPNDWWPRYFETQTEDLFTRSYSAVGFWALMKKDGGDPFASFGQLVQTGNGGSAQAVYNTAKGATPGDLEGDWGPTLAHQPDLGTRWSLDGPGEPNHDEDDEGTLAEDAGPQLTAVDPNSGDEFKTDLEADVVEVTGTDDGGGYLLDKDGAEHAVTSGDTRYCTVEEGCVCPDGSELDYPQLPKGEAHIGFSGGRSGGVGGLEGLSLDKACGGKKPTTGINVIGPGGGTIATWTKGTCSKKGGTFRAKATDSGYTLKVTIQAFGGYSRDYDLSYGGSDPQFVISGPGGPYSNANTFPNPPPFGGTIHFNPRGTKMAIGFIDAFNPSLSADVAFAGAMTCQRPKK